MPVTAPPYNDVIGQAAGGGRFSRRRPVLRGVQPLRRRSGCGRSL